MIKYAKIIDDKTGLCNVAAGDDINYYIGIGMSEMDVTQSDIDNQWYLTEKCPMKSEEEKQQEENQRIAMLSLTRGDVFRALLKAKGITRAMLKSNLELMSENTPEEKLAKEMALIDFEEALEFYRGNALIDTIGNQFGITSKQLDEFFETNDYAKLRTGGTR